MIQRIAHWLIPSFSFWGVNLGFLFFNRLSKLLVHKPGESFLLKLLATMLSPLVFFFLSFECACFSNKYVYDAKGLFFFRDRESKNLLRAILNGNSLWRNIYGMIPKHSFLLDISSCQIGLLPENFYDEVEEGSIVLKKSQSFSFCKEGLIFFYLFFSIYVGINFRNFIL